MSATESGGLPLRVLLVDADREELAAGLKSLLRFPGTDFRLASNLLSAMETAESFLPHVVLLDLGLPRLEGFHLARHLRQLQNLEQVWLVAGSRFGDVAFRTLASDAGFDDFVMKPYTEGRFQHIFDRVVPRHAAVPGGHFQTAQLPSDASPNHGPQDLGPLGHAYG